IKTMKRIQYIGLTAIFLLCTIFNSRAQEELTLSFTIDPIETLQQMGDFKIIPSSADASNFEPDRATEGDIKFAYDGNMSTMYHSSWDETEFPITLNFYFNDAEQVDYIIYHPRSSGVNGNFIEFSLYYINQQDEVIKINDYDFGGSSEQSTMEFDEPILNPKAFRFVIESGVADDNTVGYASCAEMEFYRENTSGIDLTEIFIDDIYSGLKPGVTREQILENKSMPVFFKKLALEYLSGEYPFFRVQEYEAYRPVSNLVSEFKTSSYNQYENPTGIWAETGKQLVVFVPDTKGEDISLTIRNWTTNTSRSHILRQGINYITPGISGQTYINYYTLNYQTAEPIKIHIAGGGVNGYFDRNIHEAEDWPTILNSAVGTHLDIKGNYTNLSFHVASLKSVCPTDGMRLIELYDEIIYMQFEQMGLVKYNKIPKNHMFSRNMETGYMHADGIGAAFVNSSMSAVGRPSTIVTGDNSWGIAHEYGHVNQIRPGLRWIGTVECTNNIFSSYAQYMLTTKYSTLHLRLEHETCTDIQGGTSVMGGRFNSHLHYGVLLGDNWLFQWGQDGTSDHFVKLVPMWQLNLYFKVAGDAPWAKPDWYGDICEETRNTADGSFSNGQHQINFMKRACKYTQTDLIEFFEKAGMLKPVDQTIDDYGTQRLTITEAMCQEVRDFVAQNGWQKPTGVINYISGNTIRIYNEQLPVEGTLNTGVTGSGTSRTVNHSVWKNAVVYKTYQGEEVVRITMAGTGVKDNSSTIVPYPAGATKIVAVSWDGKEFPVYQP
ncbi:MAG: M60 family metallopeptidase, partial [Bacteroidales bacterium]|nr:M60 family metallopeptidase [Bacteroidales bacterium]